VESVAKKVSIQIITLKVVK